MMHQFGPNDIGKCFLPTPTAPDEGVKALEPCPRCGNRAFVTEDYQVWCITDRCLRLPPRATEAEAIAAWNSRTKLRRLQSDNAQMRDALKPFAEKAVYADGIEADDKDYLEHAPMQAGAYRKARAALTLSEGDGE